MFYAVIGPRPWILQAYRGFARPIARDATLRRGNKLIPRIDMYICATHYNTVVEIIIIDNDIYITTNINDIHIYLALVMEPRPYCHPTPLLASVTLTPPLASPGDPTSLLIMNR